MELGYIKETNLIKASFSNLLTKENLAPDIVISLQLTKKGRLL